MLSSPSTRRLSLLLAPALLACVLAAAFLRQRLGRPSAEGHSPESKEFLQARVREWPGVTLNSIGVFSGTKVLQKFKRASFWDRKCPIHIIDHGTGAGFMEESTDAEVYAAAYNECTGVSDLVYYRVDSDKFETGGGRGSGSWSNDEELVKVMESLNKKHSEYATVVDYKGVGLFGLDRGHQAPVASFNADDESAKMTNTPTNLSPQASYLNQNTWKYLEMEMRSKSGGADEEDEEAPKSSFELITGPLYALPEAFFENHNGEVLWDQILLSGGTANTAQPWCGLDEGDYDGFRSEVLEDADGKDRKEKVTCHTGRAELEYPTDAPNNLSIHYQRRHKGFAVRVPLGYYKLAVLHDGSGHGKKTCPYIMDQAGQCLLVSVDMMQKLAHFSLEDSEFGIRGGLFPEHNEYTEYTGEVDPAFCLHEEGTIAKKKLCFDASKETDITLRTLESYWKVRKHAER